MPKYSDALAEFDKLASNDPNALEVLAGDLIDKFATTANYVISGTPGDSRLISYQRDYINFMNKVHPRTTYDKSREEMVPDPYDEKDLRGRHYSNFLASRVMKDDPELGAQVMDLLMKSTISPEDRESAEAHAHAKKTGTKAAIGGGLGFGAAGGLVGLSKSMEASKDLKTRAIGTALGAGIGVAGGAGLGYALGHSAGKSQHAENVMLTRGGSRNPDYEAEIIIKDHFNKAAFWSSLLEDFEKQASALSPEDLERFAFDVLAGFNVYADMEKAAGVEFGFKAWQDKEDALNKMQRMQEIEQKWKYKPESGFNNFDDYWAAKEKQDRAYYDSPDSDEHTDLFFDLFDKGKGDWEYNEVPGKHLSAIVGGYYDNIEKDPKIGDFIYKDKGIKGKLPVTIEDSYGSDSVITTDEGARSLRDFINKKKIPELEAYMEQAEQALTQQDSNIADIEGKIKSLKEDREKLHFYNIFKKIQNKKDTEQVSSELESAKKKRKDDWWDKDEAYYVADTLREWDKSLDLSLKDKNKIYDFYYY